MSDTPQAAQPAFFASRASAYFRELAARIADGRMVRTRHRDAPDLLRVASLLDRAQKFLLPDCGRLLDPDPGMLNYEVPVDVLHPPFPITAAEFSIARDKARQGGYEVSSYRRIALIIDLAKIDLTAELPYLGEMAVSRIRQHGGMGVISVCAVEASNGLIVDHEIRRAWVPEIELRA